MDRDRENVATMLARQFLGLDDYHKQRLHEVPYELGEGMATVEINLRSMVQGISRQIWISSAAIATQVEAKLREAASEESLAKAVAAEVKDVLATLRRDIREQVRKIVDDRIRSAIADALGDTPQRLARKIATDMVNDLWDRHLRPSKEST